MQKRIVLMVLALAVSVGGCTSYIVKSKAYLADMNYAQPKPGKFRYVKRHVTASVFWDSDTTNAAKGSPEYVRQMTTLMIQATKSLLFKAKLQHNQALYNVRISAPTVVERYMAYFIIGVAFWTESRYAVTITADVIEFL